VLAKIVNDKYISCHNKSFPRWRGFGGGIPLALVWGWIGVISAATFRTTKKSKNIFC